MAAQSVASLMFAVKMKELGQSVLTVQISAQMVQKEHHVILNYVEPK